ncbi:uncharacterized protein F5147DRAFT_668223 [Suillus discolor]|uniref:Uncharacterized protein n=1 Tax=Suillus discolor TaxID=1912936 RepID=A0A9P7K0P0_9AGAM|nr:uncharacterized protein F5147DRAFT_668223 [Suillus discolor]KAG2119109.1 hypothetical protein F5147DRAFT_668223 [Suillus discolor]
MRFLSGLAEQLLIPLLIAFRSSSFPAFMTFAKMQSPHADNLAPLPVFSRRKTPRLRGPRPCSWLQTGITTKEEIEGDWSWTHRQADLSRVSTICSRTSSDSTSSNQSSIISSSSSSASSYNDDTPISSCDISSRRHKRRSQRQRPSGPRPPSRPHSPSSPMRPLLSINTSLSPPVPLEDPVLPLPLAEFPHIAPTEPTTPVPLLPPAITFSPSDLLDWDAIFEVLALESIP